MIRWICLVRVTSLSDTATDIGYHVSSLFPTKHAQPQPLPFWVSSVPGWRFLERDSWLSIHFVTDTQPWLHHINPTVPPTEPILKSSFSSWSLWRATGTFRSKGCMISAHPCLKNGTIRSKLVREFRNLAQHPHRVSRSVIHSEAIEAL